MTPQKQKLNPPRIADVVAGERRPQGASAGMTLREASPAPRQTERIVEVVAGETRPAGTFAKIAMREPRAGSHATIVERIAGAGTERSPVGPRFDSRIEPRADDRPIRAYDLMPSDAPLRTLGYPDPAGIPQPGLPWPDVALTFPAIWAPEEDPEVVRARVQAQAESLISIVEDVIRQRLPGSDPVFYTYPDLNYPINQQLVSIAGWYDRTSEAAVNEARKKVTGNVLLFEFPVETYGQVGIWIGARLIDALAAAEFARLPKVRYAASSKVTLKSLRPTLQRGQITTVVTGDIDFALPLPTPTVGLTLTILERLGPNENGPPKCEHSGWVDIDTLGMAAMAAFLPIVGIGYGVTAIGAELNRDSKEVGAGCKLAEALRYQKLTPEGKDVLAFVREPTIGPQGIDLGASFNSVPRDPKVEMTGAWLIYVVPRQIAAGQISLIYRLNLTDLEPLPEGITWSSSGSEVGVRIDFPDGDRQRARVTFSLYSLRSSDVAVAWLNAHVRDGQFEQGTPSQQVVLRWAPESEGGGGASEPRRGGRPPIATSETP